jgi:predicted metal-dependent hydrolase
MTLVDKNIQIHIKRSDRKSISGKILPDGNIEVRAPLTMPTETINLWLEKCKHKFLPMVAEARKAHDIASKHPFGYGGEVMLLGKWRPIREATANTGLMAAYEDGAIVVQPGFSNDRLRIFVESLLGDLAISVLTNRMQYFSDMMGVRCSSWTIGNARKCHASCDSNGKITFTWRLIMMSDSVIDYIVVHELAHLKHFDHSKAFHDEVAAILPDWKERQEEYGKTVLILRCGGWL